MPVSKNKRKSKKAQSRKVNRAKAEGNFGGDGAPPAFDYPPPLSPQGAIPELMPLGTSIDGNQWQGLRLQWGECPPDAGNCPDRVEQDRNGRPPQCSQCESGIRLEEVHFHVLEDDSFVRFCKECWSREPLPEEDRTLEFEFQSHGE